MVSLDISRDRYMLAYYAPFLRVFEFGTPREGDEYRSVDGLGRDIADRLGEERRFEGSPDGTAFEALG